MLRCPDAPLSWTAPTNMTTATADTRRWTYADYCRIPPDRKRHEIIDGRHYAQRTPSVRHQSVLGHLTYELMMQVQKTGAGRVYLGPVGVHLGRGTIVQPDIVVLTARNASIVGEEKLAGVPDFVVEVLSPPNRAYDCTIKHERYERAGVREFWIVDADARTVQQFMLRNGRYGEGTVHTERVSLRILRGITVDLGEVWQ
jgi:Uma2 family endonuclease